MKVAFFSDHRFARDASGVHYSYGGLPYAALARYLKFFDSVVVVGRVSEGTRPNMTVASGDGLEMACVERDSPLSLFGNAVRLHARGVLAAVDCAIIRLPSFIGEVAVQEAIRSGKPWIAEVVGCTWDALWTHGSLAGKLMAAPMFLMTRRQVRSAPFALYVSREFLQRRYPSGGVTVGCSDVVIEKPRDDVLERRLRRIDRVDARGPVSLGLVGSLDVDYKGHEAALRSLAVLTDSMPLLKLLCLGGGDPGRWRKRAAELGVERNVEFVGTLPHGAPVLDWMDGLDLFLIPSLTEGLPRALVEAMSRALPAVGSRTGGIPELIGGSYTHPPRDSRALASLIRRLLESRTEMRACAQRNWSSAADYAVDVLEERRSRFMKRFEAYAEAVRADRKRSADRRGTVTRSGSSRPAARRRNKCEQSTPRRR
jgi:hypothetical protein